ncbi:MAG TPA: hypothetical protein VIR57_20625, partial [Chloroflexota bacterium]
MKIPIFMAGQGEGTIEDPQTYGCGTFGGAAVGIGVSVAVGRGVPKRVGVAEPTRCESAVAVALIFRSSSSIEVLGAGV